MSIYIETKRLILREFTLDDAEKLNDICSQSYILKWMPDWQRTIEERKTWIKWVQSNYLKSTKNVARIMLAVTLKTNKRLIGMIGIGNKEEVNDEIEIAYFISEEYCNKGYISDASKAMIEWSFANLKLDYLIAIVEPDNIPSQRVVEKCGFTKVNSIIILNSGDVKEKTFYYYKLYNNI